MAVQPGGALLQGLGVGIDDPDISQVSLSGQQTVTDAAEDFGLDKDLIAEKKIEALAD
jgi:hypothetical protein